MLQFAGENVETGKNLPRTLAFFEIFPTLHRMTDGAGRQNHSFPITSWGVMLSARDPASTSAKQAREEVCKTYWLPVCSYLRSLGLDPEQAEDITQNILAQFCNDGWIEKVDSSQGKLRHFFKATARHAMANHFRDRKRQKRGSGLANISADDLTEAQLPHIAAVSDETFDQHWAWTLFSKAATTLAESYAARGKSEWFAALKPALLSVDELPPHQQIGSQLGVKEPLVRTEIHRLRRRMAERLRAEVIATLDPAATSAEVDAEMRYLVQALAHERRL
jgi:RNA polymerase sigma factor (sigma-70 family)